MPEILEEAVAADCLLSSNGGGLGFFFFFILGADGIVILGK